MARCQNRKRRPVDTPGNRGPEFNTDVGSTRAAAFRVLGLGEMIFALAVIGDLCAGNERFVRDVLDRGEFDASIVIGIFVALTLSVLLLRDGIRRGWRPCSGRRSMAGMIALLALALALDTGSAVES